VFLSFGRSDVKKPALRRPNMNRITFSLVVACALFIGSPVSVAQAQTAVQQQHASGTIARGSTVCVGPLSPSSTTGVQIVGFTNGTKDMTWQVFRESSQTAPLLVFQTTARSVDQTIPPDGGFLYRACLVKTANAPQDFDLTLNSSTVE
jgi:hypothetical protein